MNLNTNILKGLGMQGQQTNKQTIEFGTLWMNGKMMYHVRAIHLRIWEFGFFSTLTTVTKTVRLG
jgi:hypothetical protein